MKIKAKEIRPGMTTVCDMGYGAHTHDEPCTVTAAYSGKSLFKQPVIKVDVTRPNGEAVRLADFDPDDVVEVQL